MGQAGRLSEELNGELDKLNDPTISDDPLSWSDSEEDRRRRATALRTISEKLRTFTYVPKTGMVVKILLFGTALPLLTLAALYLSEIPAHENARLWVWGGLAVVAVISGIIAAVVADDPNIDSDLALAAYVIPRDWSFTSCNGREAWEAYRKKFDYFDQGDENRYIGTRIWGYADKERKRAFQLFHFHYDEVTEELYYDTTTKSWKTRRVVHPHDRYGMFVAMPESKTRFRITESGSGSGLNAKIELEYGALNQAVHVYCDTKDELAVRQFLSPAVQETIMKLSNDFDGTHLDFYPGLVMIITANNFLGQVGEIELDGRAPRFMELVGPVGDRIAAFQNSLMEVFEKIRKYNDNY